MLLHTRQLAIQNNKIPVSHKYSYSSWGWTWRGPKRVEVIDKTDKIYWEYCARSWFHLQDLHSCNGYKVSENRASYSDVNDIHTCYGIGHLMELYIRTTISEKGRRNTLIRNVAKYIWSYTASYPRRQEGSLRCSFRLYLKLLHRLAASWWALKLWDDIYLPEISYNVLVPQYEGHED